MSDDYNSFLGPYLKAYLDLRVHIGATSYHRDTRARSLDFYVWCQNRITSLNHITEQVILHWIHSDPTHSHATKNTHLTFARGFFNYLLRQGLVRENPARSLTHLKTTPYKPYIYNLQDIARILTAAKTAYVRDRDGFRGLTFHTLLFLIYACGLRLGEALNLKIKDVDFTENTLALWKTKFHKERLVPFSPSTARKLNDYLTVRLKRYPLKDAGATFFCHAGGPLRGNGPTDRRFRIIVHHTGIAKPGDLPKPRIHDLRRAFAIHRLYKWYQDGCDIKNKLPLLATYMGHVNIENTQVYLTVTLALLREADRRFQSGYENLVKDAAARARISRLP